jgi:large subunit ribosomal protein L37Ae
VESLIFRHLHKNSFPSATFLNTSHFLDGMANLSKGMGPVKRFGTRYGRTSRLKRSKVEIEQRRYHKCPYCGKVAVRRKSYGVWGCEKCDVVFTARAYTVGEKLNLTQEVSNFVAELPKLRMEEQEKEE